MVASQQLFSRLSRRSWFRRFAVSHKSTLPTSSNEQIPVVPPKSPVLKYTVQPALPVPTSIVAPNYASPFHIPGILPDRPIIHKDADIERLRLAGSIAATVLRDALELVRQEGIHLSGTDVDYFVHSELLRRNAYPSPRFYAGFPKSVCVSVNEVVCHGIPDDRPLQFGDIVSLDVSCFIDGVHGDNCGTVIVGDYDPVDPSQVRAEFATDACRQHFARARRLVQATQECLDNAIGVVKAGSCLSDIGAACEQVSDAYGYTSVAAYRGHGIFEDFHIPPFVQHTRNPTKLQLEPGMIFTIEPMICEWQADIDEWDDEWTVVTRDQGWAAQFEHTILVTEEGAERLTLPDDPTTQA